MIKEVKSEKYYVDLDSDILVLQNKNAQTVKSKSFRFVNKDLIKGRRYLRSILYYLTTSRSDPGLTNDSISERLLLICCFLQGCNNTSTIILEGFYAQATSLLKQEFELLTRCLEIRNEKSKYGKTPNVSVHPEVNRKIYGFLNDISHISKKDVLQSTLFSIKVGNKHTISPSLDFKNDYFSSLFEIHLFIFLNMTIEYIVLFEEMYGKDTIELKAANMLFDKARILLKGVKNFHFNPEYYKEE